MALTVTQCYEFLRNYDKLNGSARAQAVYLKIVNDSGREAFSLANADYAQRFTRVALAAPYTTGTVSISAGGTAITGVGTTFTAAMVGRHIRFNGEAEQYLITGFTNGTSIACEAYLGSDNLSTVTYSITDERKALPTLCRSIHQIVVSNATGARGSLYHLMPKPWEELNIYRKTYQTSEYPYYFATQWEGPQAGQSGNVPNGYYWVYPATAVPQIITLYYNVWPVEMTTGTDVLPIPYEFEGPFREFLLAYLYRENKDPNWMAQLARAQAIGRDAISSSRTNTAHRQRVEWTPPCKRAFYREPVIDPSVLSQLDP